MRARAQAEGQLKSTPEQNVIVEPAASVGTPPTTVQLQPAPTTVQVVQTPPTIIKIEPANPQVIQVPSYDPTVVYGAWPPAYPPYYPYPPGYFAAAAFTFGAGIAVGAALWGEADWHHGDVNYNASQANNFTNNVNNANTAPRLQAVNGPQSVANPVALLSNLNILGSLNLTLTGTVTLNTAYSPS